MAEKTFLKNFHGKWRVHARGRQVARAHHNGFPKSLNGPLGLTGVAQKIQEHAPAPMLAARVAHAKKFEHGEGDRDFVLE